MMIEEEDKRKPGKVSLYPLKFEDAPKGLLMTKPPTPERNEALQKATDDSEPSETVRGK